MEPVLRTCGNHVSTGRIICAVCFDSIAAKKKRKSNFHEVKNNEEFLKTAKSWTEYDHDFASVLDKHDPATTKTLYYHHKCQQFFDERHRLRQTKKTPSRDADSEMEVEAGIETEHQDCQQPSVSSTRATRSSDTSYTTTKDICRGGRSIRRRQIE